MANQLNKEKTPILKIGWRTWKKINRSWKRSWWRMRRSILRRRKFCRRIIAKRNSTWIRRMRGIWLSCKGSTRGSWKRWNRSWSSSWEWKFINYKKRKTCTLTNSWKTTNKLSTNSKTTTMKSPATISNSSKTTRPKSRKSTNNLTKTKRKSSNLKTPTTKWNNLSKN